MEATERQAVMGDNAPPPHLEWIEEAETLKEEAKLWLDGSEITTDAEAEAVAKLKTLAAKLEKDADAARMVVTKPLDDQKKAVMADFKPVADTCGLIKTVATKLSTAWLNKKAAEKADADRIERERLSAERAKLEAEASAIRSLEDEECRREAVAAQIAAEKAQERSEAASVKLAGVGRSVALVTVYEAEVTDYRALAAWVWKHKNDDLMEFLNGLAWKEVRATSGNCTIDGVNVIEKKVAR